MRFVERLTKARDAHEADRDLELRVEEYLRKKGWKHSSSHPGAYWLWFKDHDGKTYRCSRDTAMLIQVAIEAD